MQLVTATPGERGEFGQPVVRRQRARGGGEVRINRSTYQVKPFYLSSETVLPIK